MLEQRKFKISKEQDGQRLGDVLAELCGCSRSKAKRLLDHRAVRVNGKRIWMAKHLIRAGDHLEVSLVTETPTEIPILYEDEHLLVVDKPAFLTANGKGSVEDLLRRRRLEKQLLVAHRLDKETTGCLIVARNQVVFDALVVRFKERSVEKTYEALVQGKVGWEKRSFQREIEGREAITHATRLAVGPNGTHLQLTIETGRKHQIRRHLQWAGHPVLGDKTYGTAGGGLPRHMLHARRIAFPHPITGARLDIQSPLPSDFLPG